MNTDSDRQQVHQPHDKGYKYLLSSKRLFLELLRSFVKRGWVEQIDESDLMNVDKSYILPDFSEKEADLVYRLKFKGQDVIFYVLMELQSSVDFQMPYRLLLYQVEIWRDILKNTDKEVAERKDFRLPPIIPIVLYNGDPAWTAGRSFRETIANHAVFGSELLDFSYILLDIQRFGESELLDLSNTIGAVFLLEQKADLEHLLQRFRKLTSALQSTPPELQQRFVTWFVHILMKRLPADSRGRMESIIATIHEKGASEVRSNLEKTLDEIMEKKFVEGIEQGIEQGIERGIEQGIERGLEQGLIRTAQNLINEGMTDAFIAKVTGLSETAIERLRNNLH